MPEVQIFTQTLIIETCCNCGIAFGITKDLYNRRSDDHQNFYCPNGHGQHYTGKSEAEKLKDQLAHTQRDRDWYANRNNELHTALTKEKHNVRAQKAAKTRLFNRVKNGVCPCCNRTFKDLQRHMLSKHPEQVKPQE